MKILYVGDGRCRLNWGARATSKALYDLLQSTGSISGIIDSSEKDPAPIASKIVRAVTNRKKKFPFNVVYPLVNKIWPSDYLTEDINASVENFLKIQSENPKLNEFYNKITECDAVVLNGEGTFIFTTPPRRGALFFLFILKLAKRIGKKTYCLNAMISDCPVNGRNKKTVNQLVDAFKECDGISLRDPLSLEILKEIDPTLNCKFIPDALFSWFYYFKDGFTLPSNGDLIIPWPESEKHSGKFDFNQPYICISGSSLAAWTREQAVDRYVSLIDKLKKTGIQLYIVPTCGGDIFLNRVSEITQVPIVPPTISILAGAAILAKASVFVSGRFHPSILASLGGTPCVFLGSNSHKTLSLQNMLEYPESIEYNAMPSERDIEAIYENVLRILDEGHVRRERILNTVTRLAKDSKAVIALIEDKEPSFLSN